MKNFNCEVEGTSLVVAKYFEGKIKIILFF